jgi:phosphoribosylformimino-5-aminoimidazole carboxamide ribotide isomerase
VIIYPAIDILGGRCVRLVEGDFARETVFDKDPADAARRWSDQGASHLHVVDLDGARAGKPVDLESIRRIRDAAPGFVQVGGGIRSLADARSLFEIGVDRVIAGTTIVVDPNITRAIAETYPGKVAAGLDARDGALAVSGWVEQSEVQAVDTAKQLVEIGVTTVIYTDIRRDGTLAGPNLDALRDMIAIDGLDVIASGGIGSTADVEAVAATGAAGVIIGRALYDGRIELSEALEWQRQQQQA